MRFLKLRRTDGDILHIWIEDSCPEDIVHDVQKLLADAVDSALNLTASERIYDKREIKGQRE